MELEWRQASYGQHPGYQWLLQFPLGVTGSRFAYVWVKYTKHGFTLYSGLLDVEYFVLEATAIEEAKLEALGVIRAALHNRIENYLNIIGTIDEPCSTSATTP